MKKISDFNRFGYSRTVAFPNIFLFYIFFCGRITIDIDSICIIFEYTAHVPASRLVIFSLD